MGTIFVGILYHFCTRLDGHYLMDFCTPDNGRPIWPCRMSREAEETLPELPDIQGYFQICHEQTPCETDGLTTAVAVTTEPPPGPNLIFLSFLSLIILAVFVIYFGVRCRRQKFNPRLVFTFGNRETTRQNPVFKNELQIDVEQSDVLVDAEARLSPLSSPMSQSGELGYPPEASGVIYPHVKDKRSVEEK